MDPGTTLQAMGSWSFETQLEFVFQLWEQLAEEGWQPVPSEELAAELSRRLEAHEKDPENVRTWDQVMERVR